MQQNSTLKDYYNSSVPLNPDDYWRLDYDTVLMVLENYHDLATGAQPGGMTSSDGNPESQRATSYHAPFESSCMLAAEVARRVRLCGIDGMICEERYGLTMVSKPKTVEQIAEARCIDVRIISRSITRVTWYCTGRNLRKLNYEQFKNQGRGLK